MGEAAAQKEHSTNHPLVVAKNVVRTATHARQKPANVLNATTVSMATTISLTQILQSANCSPLINNVPTPVCPTSILKWLGAPHACLVATHATLEVESVLVAIVRPTRPTG